MRILLVDDDQSTLTMLCLHLKRAGFEVECTLDPNQALASLAGRRFDWLIVDGQLEPLDGFQIAARARKIQPDLPIVMISGVYDRSDIAGHPIGKLFQKPVDTAALSSYLQAHG